MLEEVKKLSNICGRIVSTFSSKLPVGLSSCQVVSSIRAATKLLKDLTRESNQLFADEINPILDKIHTLSEEDETDFFNLAQKLSSFTVRVDTGMALKIYQALLKRARFLGDTEKKLKYLYWCGITLFYHKDSRNAEILEYFQEGADYCTAYLEFKSKESRQYIHRCLGNCVMVLFAGFEPEKAKEKMDKVLSFWNELMFLGIDVDFPWTTYFLSCLHHYRSFFTRKMHSNPKALTREEIKSIYKVSLEISKLSHTDETAGKLTGATRYDLGLWEAQFVSGQINMTLFCENVKRAQQRFAANDYSSNALHANIMQPCFLMFYAKVFLSDSETAEKIISEQLEYVTNYMKALPPEIDPVSISTYIALFARSTAELLPPDVHFQLIVKLTTFRHIPTYAHAITVSKLSGCIAAALVNKNPEQFIGLLGIETAEQAVEMCGDIINLASNCGLCHDVGKLPFIRNQTMYARRLSNDEINLVRDHVKEGLGYFSKNQKNETVAAYRSVIEGHHVYYNGLGGYPDSFDICSSKYKTLINIITVADSIDAATDDIGKVYADYISLDEVIKEITETAGTRYSPYIAELLSEETLKEKLKEILSRERECAYYEAYRFACGVDKKGGESNDK